MSVNNSLNLRYVKVIDGIVVNYQYTLNDLFIDNPNAQIYKGVVKLPCPELLKNYNTYPLVTELKPNGPTDQVVTEVTPIFKDGEWHQQWESRPYTEQEKIYLQDEFANENRVAVDILLQQAAESE